MRKKVRIGDLLVGDGEPCMIIAEIGINHNGSLEIAWRLIDEAVDAGCNAVKFQKRTVEVVYSPDELARPRESPFGTTNGDLKRALEFGQREYEGIDRYCKAKKIMWSASCWDPGSVEFVERFDPPFYKIASACLTDHDLLRRHRVTGRPIVLSTGMSTMDQIRHAVDVLGGTDALVILHCTSTYPSRPEELNLRMIQSLREEFDCPIGYSGHEVGLATTVAAVMVGACMVERHITLDRSLWGSDQAASVESQGFKRLVRDIRVCELAMGDGIKKVYDSELPIMAKLRRVG
jgi:N-acetylneuraminate synthase